MSFKIGFVGVPGSGKSYAANRMHSALLKKRVNSALITEAARDYLEEHGSISTAKEQYKVQEEQLRRELMSEKWGFTTIVTDSPVFLGEIFMHQYFPKARPEQKAARLLSKTSHYDTIFYLPSPIVVIDDGVRFQTQQELYTLDKIIRLNVNDHAKNVWELPRDFVSRNKAIDYYVNRYQRF